MKRVMIGDILEADYGLIVQGVNCQSQMNSGLAKQIRDRWPKVFDDYQKYLSKFKNNKDALGTLFITDVPERDYVGIASGFTQLFYGRELNHRYVSYSAIQNVMREAFTESRDYGSVVNYPQIGAGLGGGDWCIISAIIDDLAENEFADVDTFLWVQD